MEIFNKTHPGEKPKWTTCFWPPYQKVWIKPNGINGYPYLCQPRYDGIFSKKTKERISGKNNWWPNIDWYSGQMDINCFLYSVYSITESCSRHPLVALASFLDLALTEGKPMIESQLKVHFHFSQNRSVFHTFFKPHKFGFCSRHPRDTLPSCR